MKNREIKDGDIFVSLDGNDKWSGKLAAPDKKKTDGPFRTIEKAKETVNLLKRTGMLDGEITVWLREGTYFIDKPLVFEAKDSAPVTYASCPGEKAIINGGRKIEGWKIIELNGMRIWKTVLAEAKAGKWYFRQLFIDGVRRNRARLPKVSCENRNFMMVKSVPGEGEEAKKKGVNEFFCHEGDIKNWKNLTDVEIVVLHYWIEDRLPIKAFDAGTGKVTTSRRSRMALNEGYSDKWSKYYVENVFEALTEPGEWYLDRTSGELFYVPMDGEKPEDVKTYAPIADQLLKLSGNPEKNEYVEFIRFENLTFENTEGKQLKGRAWCMPEDDLEYGSDSQAAATLPGAIELSGARCCSISNCEIRNIGWYGLNIGSGCTGISVIGNTITDLGAGGIKINGADANGPKELRTGNNRIIDNHIYSGGHLFPSAVGIISMHSYGNNISHNHIHHLYYTGISCGWVWGYAESVSKDNRIEFNHIHDIGFEWLSDMGGIYTLGVQPGTIIRGNLIHNVDSYSYGGWGIYLDEGSSHIIVENNICYALKSEPFHTHYGRENIIRNNIFAFGRGEAQITLSRGENHVSFTFERNIVITNDKPIFMSGYGADFKNDIIRSDSNLFWSVNSDGKVGMAVKWGAPKEKLSLTKWRKTGRDLHSLFENPGFRNVAKCDFRLKKDSPALKTGFTPFELKEVGVRPK
jgi:hypothetical protein